jgi:diguanylate cyclase (GGDEF)-like protein
MGGADHPHLDDDPSTAEHAPAPGVGAREIERELGIPRTARAARHWLLWPATAVLVIGSGGIVAVDLSRGDRPVDAFAIAMTLAGFAGAATMLLVTRLLAAQRLALRDGLTGLPNRALLDDRIAQALARARRADDSFALLVVDLDGFKGVNDIRGHEAGNQVLRSIARRLESVVRESDTVARVGGDEFVVLSYGTGGDDEAAVLVGRLRRALRRPYRIDGGTVEIDASIGWAIFPRDGLDSDELLVRADGQMYATKRDISEESATALPPLDGSVVRDLEDALGRDEIVVHYQPIVALRSGVVKGAEALVRRVRDDRLVSPAQFVPHVERTPVMRTLTLAVAADALRRLHEWEQVGERLGVAVNIPYRMVDDLELAAGLQTLLERSGIEPDRLTIEVVPSGPGAGSAIDVTVVQRLRNLGVRLSLDDLGRASSVAAIRMLPLDQVKIDAMFLHEAGQGGPADSIVRSLVELAHGLGLETVAEGVESKLAWEAAAALGCDLAQGFYLGHPMPPKQFSDWLTGTWPAVTLAG